jgi:LemA protein
MVFAIVLIVIVVLVIAFLVLTYNGLVQLRNKIDAAWAQIDVQLKRRYDLIPNLVETVKGYASHESETFEKVTQARNMAVNAQGPAETAQADNVLTGTLKSLFAVSEAYPDLKANQNFSQLQEELTSTENRIGFARQHYNDTVARYEESRQAFPTNMIAGMFNFQHKDYFTVANATEREAPKVSFS